jgi:hypothetical protein
MNSKILKLYSEDMQEVIKKYPSICYGCNYVRKVCANENTQLGWTACSKRIFGE